MREPLSCGEIEELLSDWLTGSAPAGLREAIEAHLDGCGACRDLLAALRDVVDALKDYPALDAPAGLAERAAEAALAGRRRAPLLTSWAAALRLPEFGLPAGLQVLAATVALAVTAGALAAATQSSRLREKTVSAEAYLSERKDRVVEDFRLLRVVVTTAFEGRLDRMNDRVDDYRRLLEKRRAAEQQEKRTGTPKSDAGAARSARQAQLPPGRWNPNNEGRGVVTASERAGGTSLRHSRRES